jgi:hypothetical protein
VCISKFTPEGSGAVTYVPIRAMTFVEVDPIFHSVRSILVSPTSSNPQDPRDTSEMNQANDPTRLSPPDPPTSHSHRILKTDGRKNRVIIRIEVSDDGPGIRPSDLQESELFSP